MNTECQLSQRQERINACIIYLFIDLFFWVIQHCDVCISQIHQPRPPPRHCHFPPKLFQAASAEVITSHLKDLCGFKFPRNSKRRGQAESSNTSCCFFLTAALLSDSVTWNYVYFLLVIEAKLPHCENGQHWWDHSSKCALQFFFLFVLFFDCINIKIKSLHNFHNFTDSLTPFAGQYTQWFAKH